MSFLQRTNLVQESTCSVSNGDARGITIPLQLAHSPADPLAVNVLMHAYDPYGAVEERVPTAWIVSRDVMWAAVQQPGVLCGILDVRMLLEEGTEDFVLYLSNGVETAVVRIDAAFVHGFLSETYTRVPAGSESMEFTAYDLEVLASGLFGPNL